MTATDTTPTPNGATSTERIVFIGLGVMGHPMAANLHAEGRDVIAFDLSPAALAAASADGIPTTKDVRSALSDATVVITMLPNTDHVGTVIDGENGTIANCRPGTLHIDMSSISPVTTLEYAERSVAAGIRYVDAPVSGGMKGASEGNLSIMAGGADEDIERARPVLEPMAGTITHMGEVGTGQATKACNQIAVAINIQAMCEAFTLGSKLGVDLTRLREALLGGSTASWVLENLGPQIIAGDDSAGFRIALQVKDLRLALDAAQRTNTPLPASSGVLDMYLEAMAHGEESNGNQALSRAYERLANVTIAN